MAKRKQRGIPSPKAAGQHHHHYNQLKSWRPEQAAARDFSAPQQTKLTAQYAAAFVRSDGVDSLSGGFSTLPRPRDGHLQETEQRDRSNSKEPGAAAQGTLGWCPPLGKLQQQERQPSHPSVATAAAAAGSTALSDGESNNNGDDDGDDSGSTKAKVAGSTRERSGLGRDNQGLKVMMVKAKLASDNIRLLLHAKVSRFSLSSASVSTVKYYKILLIQTITVNNITVHIILYGIIYSFRAIVESIY